MRPILTVFCCAALPLLTGPASRLEIKDLPPAVQKTVRAETKGAQIKGLSKEVGGGKTLYEVETVVNGRGRDMLIDTFGAVVELEEEVKLESIPAPARAAIEKKAAGGKIAKVEILTRGKTVAYEAAIVKGGKTSTVAVAPDGSTPK